MNKPDKNAAARGPLFRPLRNGSGVVQVELDGETVVAREGDTVASFLLGVVDPGLYRRSAASGLPRAPLCMMGVCFECLVEVDGQPNQQGCLVRVRDGMRIRRQVPEEGRS